MRELLYEVEFLSDVVLPDLDFIPGSNFLGIVAQKYDDFEDSFALFHSGDVRFGDAHILHHGKESYKTPLSFFHEKLNASKIYNHHLIKDFNDFQQLKQLRNGYITADKEIITPQYNYAQKSAYDRDLRRSKDASMFGYRAMRAGQKWRFTLKFQNISENDEKLMRETLEGRKRLGKSKSAEYGAVQITFLEEKKAPSPKSASSEVVLYTKSRLALYDAEANPTYRLEYLCSGLSEVNISQDKTQIKTSTFTPYNFTRKTQDYERVVIEKGSVIVLNNITSKQLDALQNGVGAYLSEGFGEVLINPDFLLENEFTLVEQEKEEPKITKLPIKNPFVVCLQQRQREKEKKLAMAQSVADFITKNVDKKMNAQWGTIRSLSAQARSDQELYALLFESEPEERPKGFLRSKRAKDKWSKEIIEHLENSYSVCKKENFNFIDYIKLISMQMPKVKELKEEEDAK